MYLQLIFSPNDEGFVPAFISIEINHFINLAGYSIAVPEELRGKRFLGRLAASRIRGDSMEPTIYNGDTVICDNMGYQEDGIYAVIYQGKGFVKRLQTVYLMA